MYTSIHLDYIHADGTDILHSARVKCKDLPDEGAQLSLDIRDTQGNLVELSFMVADSGTLLDLADAIKQATLSREETIIGFTGAKYATMEAERIDGKLDYTVVPDDEEDVITYAFYRRIQDRQKWVVRVLNGTPTDMARDLGYGMPQWPAEYYSHSLTLTDIDFTSDKYERISHAKFGNDRDK